jgi:hypothetical protein
MEIAVDEHIITCSICGRNHLKLDHHVQFKAPQMTETKVKKYDATTAINQQILAEPE